MVIPVGKNVQEMIIVRRISQSKFEKETQRTWAYITWNKSITGDESKKTDNELLGRE